MTLYDRSKSQLSSQLFPEPPTLASPPIPGNPPMSANALILSNRGALGLDQAKFLVGYFVDKIQAPTAPVGAHIEQWVSMATPPLWERAEWIDGARLEQDLRDVLQNSWCMDSPDKSTEYKAKAIARCKSPFVAFVDQERVFGGLVDRQALLEKLAVHYAEPSNDRSPVKP